MGTKTQRSKVRFHQIKDLVDQFEYLVRRWRIVKNMLQKSMKKLKKI